MTYVVKTNKIGAQSGNVIHHQDHVILPISFSTKNRMNNKLNKSILIDVLMFFILVITNTIIFFVLQLFF